MSNLGDIVTASIGACLYPSIPAGTWLKGTDILSNVVSGVVIAEHPYNNDHKFMYIVTDVRVGWVLSFNLTTVHAVTKGR